MEKIPSILEKVKTDIQEGKDIEEIFSLLSSLGGEIEGIKELAERLPSIPDRKTSQLLLRMFEVYSDKSLRKIIKRSLYRLKTKGVRVEEGFFEKKEPILKPLEVEPPRGFGEGIDSYGDRLLLLTIHHLGKGWKVLQGIVNDREGLVDFFSLEMSKKEMRDYIEEIRKESDGSFLEMEASYVAFLFHEAYQLSMAHGREIPQEYPLQKWEIEKIKKTYEKPLIYSLIKEEEVEGNEFLLERSVKLFRIDPFSSWRLDEEEIKPYAEEVQEADRSRLFLTPSQKEARFQEILSKALTTLFHEAKRSLYQRRMEEMAYFLYLMGKEEEARISLSVALDLKKPPNLLRPNPFLYQLLSRSIFALLSEAEEKSSKEPSLIIKP